MTFNKYATTLTWFLFALAFLAIPRALAGSLRTNNSQQFTSATALRNYILNTGAEANVLSVTDASSIVTRVTASPLEGDGSFQIDATATSQSAIFLGAAFQQGLLGQGCQASIVYQGDATLYQAYATLNGVQVTTTVTLLNVASPASQLLVMPFACGVSTTDVASVVIISTGNGAAIKVDTVKIGASDGTMQVNQSQVIVSAKRITTNQTISSTAATQVIFNDELLDASDEYNATTGLFTAKIAGEFLIGGALALSNYVSDESAVILVYKNGAQICYTHAKQPTTNASVSISPCRVSLSVGDTAAIYSDSVTDASYDVSAEAGTFLTITRFPSQSQIVQRADTPGNFSTAYTPTFTGMGTVTVQSFKYQCLAPDLVHIQGRFTTGTNTGVEARISLPSGMTAASAYSTLEVVGPAGSSGASTTYFGMYATAEPSLSYLTLSVQTSTLASLTKMLGNFVANGNPISLEATVRLASGSPCGNVPRAFVAGSVYFGRPSIVKRGQVTVACNVASSLGSNPDGMGSATSRAARAL